MRILIAGSRTRTPDVDEINAAINLLPPRLLDFEKATIVHGNAQGVDASANAFAILQEYELDVFHADWKTHGKAAGPIRNQAMIDSGIDAAIVFWDGESKGTANTLKLLSDAKTPRVVVIA